MFVLVNERDAPPVTDQPTVAVSSWCVVQTANGDRHLLAFLETGSLRITSALATFDPQLAELTTRSGRRYQLLGPPEKRQPQLGLMRTRALDSGVLEPADVSDELWARVGQHRSSASRRRTLKSELTPKD